MSSDRSFPRRKRRFRQSEGRFPVINQSRAQISLTRNPSSRRVFRSYGYVEFPTIARRYRRELRQDFDGYIGHGARA